MSRPNRTPSQDENDSPVAPAPVSEDAIVGLDEIGDEEGDDRNLELQQLGLSKRRAKSFAQELDASMTRSRVEEIIYIEASRRPRTLRATELEAWFAKINPKALSSHFRLSARNEDSASSSSLSTSIGDAESSSTSSSSLSGSNATHWLDIMHPTENTLEVLARIFDIHPLTIKDALVMRDGSHQKHEIFEHYHAISMSEAFYEPGSNNLQSVDIFLIVMSDVIISLRHDLSGSVEDVKNQLKHGTLVTRSSVIEASWIMYSVLNSICEMFVDLVRQILLEMRTLNELVLVLTAGEQSDFLRRIGLARDRVSFLRSQMIAKRDILRSLCLSGDSSSRIKYASTIVPSADIHLRQDTKLFLRDVLHSVMKMMDQVEEARETLANVNNTYLARVSIEVSEASNRMNQVMKKFNAMATIVLPLTLVTGLWGMNVPVPGQLGDEKPDLSWFFSIVAGLAIACFLSLVVFRKFNWM